jgi:hypothetical protein
MRSTADTSATTPSRAAAERLSLALLVLGVLANHAQNPFAPDHLALLADQFD